MNGRIGGAENSLLLLISGLLQKHSVSAACPQDSPLAAKVSAKGCRCYGLPPRRGRSYLSIAGLVDWLRLGWRLRSICAAARPDLIHANSVYSAVVCLPFIWATGTRLVLHWRDVPRWKVVSRIVCVCCDRVITVSSYIKRQLIAQGVEIRKIEVVNNGISLERTGVSRGKSRRQRSSCDKAKSTVIFANVGQFVPWKKQMVFLAAARKVEAKMARARFWLVGDDLFGRNPGYVRWLREYVQAYGLTSRVSFVGWQENIRLVWKSIHCLVHTADKEPFGRVIIEAMAARVPVIAVNAGGPAEILEDGRTGILVPPDDPDALCEAMLRLGCDPGMASELSSAGYDVVARKFQAAETARRVEQVYTDILCDMDKRCG